MQSVGKPTDSRHRCYRSAFVSVLFGAAGAGLGGYKIARRTGEVEEFVFDPIGALPPPVTISARQATDYTFVLGSLTGFSRQLHFFEIGQSKVSHGLQLQSLWTAPTAAVG